ncbi:unnamed protein product [Linum tenue]|uniref:Uncharacterized protein n=1 Tax=Linum tenue TaxID=586396 RepID=A0AAV0PBD7_9ROSI|nr:unnamed protein product [Linum tenue]
MSRTTCSSKSETLFHHLWSLNTEDKTTCNWKLPKQSSDRMVAAQKLDAPVTKGHARYKLGFLMIDHKL